MRVTDNTTYGALRDSISRSRGRMEGLQTESATLRKLNTPSDDPIGAAKVLEIRTEKVNNDQYQMNAKMAETFLSNTDQALSEITEMISRVKEIAINQSSDASSNDETRIGVAEEVTQLFQAAIATANRRIGDRFLFGGYKTQTPPVDADGKYRGDDGHMLVEVAKDVFISMNVPGIEAFNTDPKRIPDKEPPRYEPSGKNKRSDDSAKKDKGADSARTPAAGEGYVRSTDEITEGSAVSDQASPQNINVFDEIQDVRTGLLTGNMEGIRATLDRLDTIYSKMVATRAKIGSRLQGLQNTSQAIERHNLVNAQLTSSIEDADMAKVVSDLAREETIFRSALGSSHKLIQPTLLDFLK